MATASDGTDLLLAAVKAKADIGTSGGTATHIALSPHFVGQLESVKDTTGAQLYPDAATTFAGLATVDTVAATQPFMFDKSRCWLVLRSDFMAEINEYADAAWSRFAVSLRIVGRFALAIPQPLKATRKLTVAGVAPTGQAARHRHRQALRVGRSWSPVTNVPTRAPACCPAPRCVNSRPCPDHPQTWRGRKMPPGWPATRARILSRDGHTCRACGAPATEVHHLRPGAEADATLVSLCHPCHALISRAQALAARGITPQPPPTGYLPGPGGVGWPAGPSGLHPRTARRPVREYASPAGSIWR